MHEEHEGFKKKFTGYTEKHRAGTEMHRDSF